MEMREWDEPLFLSYEKDVLALYVIGHPLAQFAKQITYIRLSPKRVIKICYAIFFLKR